MNPRVALWNGLLLPELTETERYARAWQQWRESPTGSVLAASDFAVLLMAAASEARPAGTRFAPAEPLQTAAEVGPVDHHLRAASAAWNYVSAAITEAQLDVADPTLEAAQVELATEFEGDAVFWLATLTLGALHDLSERLSPRDFEETVGPLLSTLEID